MFETGRQRYLLFLYILEFLLFVLCLRSPLACSIFLSEYMHSCFYWALYFGCFITENFLLILWLLYMVSVINFFCGIINKLVVIITIAACVHRAA